MDWVWPVILQLWDVFVVPIYDCCPRTGADKFLGRVLTTTEIISGRCGITSVAFLATVLWACESSEQLERDV